MPRLPQPGSDSGAWGNILNDYLSQVHKTDGSLKDNIVTEDQLSTAVKAKLNASSGPVLSTDITDSTTAGRSVLTANDVTIYSAAEKTKLSGVATGATANDTNANLLNRANHTGTQTASTISDFAQTVLDTVGDSEGLPVYNVKTFGGATGDDTADDTGYIQYTINQAGAAGGGIVYFPKGIYKITGAIDLGGNWRHQVILMGDGWNSIIKQYSTTEHAFVSTDTMNLQFHNLKISGPGSGSGDGIHLEWTVNTNIFGVNMSHLMVEEFGGNGISAQTLLMSNMTHVSSFHNGGDGFYFYGTGTSLTFDSCFAAGNGGYGWHMNAMNYCSWQGCGADGNTTGWYVTGISQALTFTGCGSEINEEDGFVIDGAHGITLVGMGLYGNKRYGIHVKGTTTATLQSVFETPGSGTVYSIFTEGGAMTTVLGYAAVSPVNFTGFSDTVLLNGVLTINGKEVVTDGNAVKTVGVSTGSESRPSTSSSVLWIGGSSEPTNMATGDLWFEEV